MNEIAEAFRGVLERSRAVKQPGDYTQDGLLYCGNCRTPKQCRISVGGKTCIVGCQCDCRERQYAAEQAAERERQRMYAIEEMRAAGMADKAVREYRFDVADDSPEIRHCKAYFDHFAEAKQAGRGLILWGNTGNGKTFAAACIANALIDKGIPAMVTSFPKILSANWKERADIARQLNKYDLLVLDDLGAERQSEYALETVYTVIDERYKSGLPLIVTTNLPLAKMQHPDNMDYQRIYDRVLEMCSPMCFRGASRRKKKAAENLDWLKGIVDEQ